MSTSKTFTYPVTVVAYREEGATIGTAELYVMGRHVDTEDLDRFNVDMSSREALETDNNDLIEMLDFNEDGAIRGIKSGREADFFEWAVADLVEGGYVLDTGLSFDSSLRCAFGENVFSNLGECCDYSFKAENGTYVIGFTMQSREPAKYHGAPIRSRDFF